MEPVLKDELSKLCRILLPILHEDPIDTKLSLNTDEQRLAIEHGIGNIISSKCDICIEPPKIVSYANSYKVWLAYAEEDFKFVFANLIKRNIKYTVLKGYVLSKCVYKEQHWRPYSDIDILIDEKDRQIVHDIFVQLGFVNPRGWLPKYISNQFSMCKNIGGKHLYFDIHLKLSNNYLLKDTITIDSIYHNSALCYLDGVPCLNRVFLLIHACVHLANNSFTGHKLKLIWYLDIYLLTAELTEGDIQTLIDVVTKKRISNILMFSINKTNQFFPSSSLANLSNLLTTIPYDKQLSKISSDGYAGKTLLLLFFETKSLSKRLLILREVLFPPKIEIINKYGAVKNKLIYLYYVKRIANGLLRFIKNHG